MTEQDFILELRSIKKSRDVAALRRLLTSQPELTSTVRTSGSGLRFIDYNLYSVMVHESDDLTALAMLRVFLEFGANPNVSHHVQSESGWLPTAVDRGLQFARLLVEHGARINHDLFGQPACWALISAVCSGKPEIVRYLIDRGAVVNFVNIHGLSPLDYAQPGTEIEGVLLGVGAKRGADLPRGHLPPPAADPEPPTHASLRDHLTDHFYAYGEPAEVEVFPLREIAPGHPPFDLLKVPRWEGGYVGFVTDGVSAVEMPVPEGVTDAIRRAEFAVLLPPDWPLDEESLRQPRHRWPFDWLRRVARWPFESGSYYRRANVIANGEPPEPLGDGSAFTCWLVRRHPSEAEGRWRRPDGTVVELVMLTGLYTAERDYEREHGIEALIERLDAEADHSTFPGRMDVTIPPEG